MKVKSSKFIFALLVCFSFFSFSFAQTKTVALKFDEFDDSSDNQFYSYEEINLSQRIESLVKQVKKERGVKVYIIYYRARQINDGEVHKIGNWANRTESEVRYKANLEYEDVITIDGGYRERNTLEYWIAPKNAEPPKPLPTFDKSESFVCPTIQVYGDAREYDKNKTVSFSVATYDLKADVTFQWKLSVGEIVEGQGTKSIAVNLKNISDKHITAFAEINGFPYPCAKVGYATVDVSQKLYPFDSAVRYNYSDLSARLESFMMELMNNPTTRGYIIVYAGRKGGTREMERAITSVKRVFAFRKYDLSRVTIVRGGYRDYDTVDSWILQPGVEPPQPTPTVDSKFINILKQPKKVGSRK